MQVVLHIGIHMQENGGFPCYWMRVVGTVGGGTGGSAWSP